MSNNKKQKKETVVQVNQKKEQNFYPNIEYNKSRRVKYFSLLILLTLCLGMVIGSMVATKQWMIAAFMGMILVMMLIMIPSVIKNHPVKKNVPELTVYGKDVTAQGKQLRVQDIEKVVVNITVPTISKKTDENQQYLKEVASTYPEEPYLGTFDIYLKPGPNVKKGEAIYMTIDDCLTAASVLIEAGVKHYAIGFSMKKWYEPATFSLKKQEAHQTKLTDLSEKERLKQII